MVFVLYDQERRVLEAIVQYINRYGFAPTLREVGEVTGMTSPSTVHEHVVNLIKKGYLVRTGFKRGFDLAPRIKKRELEDVESTIELPLFGFITAGSPIEPHPDPTATFRVPASMVSEGKQGYTLQVKGNSMKEDGIFDGDYVVVEYTETANNGDIIIAFIEENGLATIKRFYKENNYVVLKPANSEMQPIYAKEIKVQGKVVGLIRKF